MALYPYHKTWYYSAVWHVGGAILSDTIIFYNSLTELHTKNALKFLLKFFLKKNQLMWYDCTESIKISDEWWNFFANGMFAIFFSRTKNRLLEDHHFQKSSWSAHRFDFRSKKLCRNLRLQIWPFIHILKTMSFWM